MPLARLGIPDRYYSFDQGGWRFLVLDSTHLPEGEVEYSYSGKLDEEQYQWLAAQLESDPDTTPGVRGVAHPHLGGLHAAGW